jgi:hypothetical protein
MGERRSTGTREHAARAGFRRRIANQKAEKKFSSASCSRHYAQRLPTDIITKVKVICTTTIKNPNETEEPEEFFQIMSCASR